MHLSELQKTDVGEYNKIAINFLTEKLESPAKQGKKQLVALAVDFINTTLGEGRVAHGTDMFMKDERMHNAWTKALRTSPGSEVSHAMSIGSPIGKIAAAITEAATRYVRSPAAAAAHAVLAHSCTGLAGIPLMMAPVLAEMIFAESGVLPFIAEMLGIKGFHDRVQEPICQ